MSRSQKLLPAKPGYYLITVFCAEAEYPTLGVLVAAIYACDRS